MPNWSGGILTTRGQSLQAKVEAGTCKLTLTKMKLGSGTLGAGQDIKALTDLIAPEKIVAISGVSASGNVTTVTGAITNAGLATGFSVRELGLFATDPDLGEILYSITIDSTPDYLPAEGGSVVVTEEFDYHIVLDNAASVTATINPSGMVTVSVLQDYIAAHNVAENAHSLMMQFWQPGYNYAVGDCIRPKIHGSYKYMECTVGGQSGTVEPTWGDVGSTVTDGTVTWIVCDIKNKHGKKKFTSSDTFTVPLHVTKIYVSGCGGGGGGGGGTATNGGSGGGGAACVYKSPYTVTPGQQIAITIGAAGDKGNNGANGAAGGTTSVGTLCTMVGGGGGSATGSSMGASGGFGGQVGEDAIYGTSTLFNGGSGGSSLFGVGGARRNSSGPVGVGYGAGGGGGAGGATNYAGGAGAPGFVLIEW